MPNTASAHSSGASALGGENTASAAMLDVSRTPVATSNRANAVAPTGTETIASPSVSPTATVMTRSSERVGLPAPEGGLSVSHLPISRLTSSARSAAACIARASTPRRFPRRN